MIVTFSLVPKTGTGDRAALQTVEVNDELVGEVWRERVKVPNAKRIPIEKFRWFAKSTDDWKVIGRGTRVAMIMGPGFEGREKAFQALLAYRAEMQASVPVVQDPDTDEGDEADADQVDAGLRPSGG